MLINNKPDRKSARERLRALAPARAHIVAAVTIVVAVAAIAMFWLEQHYGIAGRSSTQPRDLAQLFKDGAGATLDSGDFVDLRDPACTRAFALRLTQVVFMRVSRNCSYAISVESGRARANFLDPAKGAVELAPGRRWSAADIWSLTPLTTEAEVRLEPNS
jgi:hypothetical protein